MNDKPKAGKVYLNHKKDVRHCHLCGSVEENKYCINKSCYEYTRYE